MTIGKEGKLGYERYQKRQGLGKEEDRKVRKAVD